MERWEIIERAVLLLVSALLLGLGVWLAFFHSGPERFAWLALLIPCMFWIFWQALYEDNLESSVSPSSGEYLLAFIWIWFRRLVLGAISCMFAILCMQAWSSPEKNVGAILICAVLAFFVGWVAIFGAGKSKSMSDDLGIYRKRKNRYK